MVTIVDYIGNTDEKERPMGHPIKVINENVEMLLPLTDVRIAVPKSYIPEIVNKEKVMIVELHNHVDTFSMNRKVNFQKKWGNLRKLFCGVRGIVWFINIDFSLFLYLFLVGSGRNKVWITLCYNPLRGVSGWRKKIINAVLKKIDLIIVTNRRFLSAIPGSKIYIPDYYYKENFYSHYKNLHKRDQIVCLGTMGETKQLEEFVDAAKELHKPVIIKGNFAHNPVRYENLKKRAAGFSNILIENKYVDNTEYYRLIAESKYVALPYDMNLYDERTSGILIETIFLDGVPIAPKKLLDYNTINGLGYNSLKELPEAFNNLDDISGIVSKNRIYRSNVFSEQAIQKKIEKEIMARG